ncbi:MAG: DUF3467 domain-containing protein [Anaerolineae bacterium]|jgi:hypothetical protein
MAEPSHDSKRQVHLNVELPADLDAIYSNIAFITHSPSEMIIDFGRVLPNVPKAKIHVRVILTPMNAKLLHQALGENLDKFEAKFGKINTPQDGFDEQRPIGFHKQS